MDTKISAQFWGKDRIENAPAEVKLAALWMLTNSRVNMAGYAETTEKRFAFETGLAPEWYARALDALHATFKALPGGYWIRGYITHQIGRGDSLVRNHMAKPLVACLKGLGRPSVIELVIEEYPELEGFLMEKPSARAPEAPEQSRAEQSRVRAEKEKEQSQGVQGDPRADTLPGLPAEPEAEPSRDRKSPKNPTPDECPEPLRSRLLRIGALLHRRASTPWKAEELAELRSQRLDAISEEEFAADLTALEGYYGLPLTGDDDFRRRELIRLLRHWPDDVRNATKRAKEWKYKHDPDGLGAAS